ncbi:MAG: aminotransferase class III-fold pyridoxal phosphate-dependent enzyme [Actinomycetia bacterium]|nr:aminotransferase class III-fold pyridoxal phosphate-dependent enzyme [Actinomycetes bacterium]
MESLITAPLQERLERLRNTETETFNATIAKSRAWLAEASELMPNGVPVSWMSGFWRHSPVVAVSGCGTIFTDLDGNTYRDFNLCALAMAAGFAPQPIVDAISRQAALGNHFLLPTADAIEVSQLLRDRFGLPRWQYTLSASGANVDALRVARAFTGRQRVVVFQAKYHGHMDEMLWSKGEPDGLGLPDGSGAHLSAVPFNDLPALEAALAAGDVAAVLLEPVMTNCGLVMPQPGFHEAVRAVARRHGTLVIADVTHTQFAVYGGGAQEFGLDPDIITGGKGIGGGMPVGVFGMTTPLADFLADHVEGDFTVGPGVPTGGTVYANALSMAAAHAGLAEVFTESAHRRVDELGAQLQHGLQKLVDASGLGFTIDRWGGRCQWRLTADAPVTGYDGYGSVNEAFADARKAFLMNRGIWDAIATSGPAISFAATSDDVDAYLAASEEFLAALR